MAVTLHGVAFAGPALDICAAISGFGRFETLGRLAYLLNATGSNPASEELVVAFLGAEGAKALLVSGIGVREGGGIRVQLATPKDPAKVRAGNARVVKHGPPSAWSPAWVDPSTDPSRTGPAWVDPSTRPSTNPVLLDPVLDPTQAAPVTGGRGGSGSDQGSPSDLSAPLKPLVLRSPAIEDPLSGRAKRRATNGWSGDEIATAHRVWALQEELRAEVIPGSRGLEPNQLRLDRILKLLRGGVTEADCVDVLRAQAERVRREPTEGKWFNGDTTWRANNFDRQLGQLGADQGGERRGPVNGFDHVVAHVRASMSKDST